MDETKKISIFDQSDLDRRLAKLIPKGDNNAIVFDMDLHGAKFAAHVEKGTHWTLQGVYEHDWSGEDSLAGQVIYHWKS